MELFLKDQYEDKTKMEELIIQSSLKWEIVRPGMLTDDENSSTFRILKDLSKGMKVGKISRANVAEYLVDEAEEPRMLNQYVTLTS
ncbi:NAD(P)-binding oxidoreductase [Sphingobacterium sp.]|uniref:NAD(P)-binding oxidoreductase n=1 Tax=Sphingobacterium sp. TaxID=341027 RepID=UPI002FD8C341